MMFNNLVSAIAAALVISGTATYAIPAPSPSDLEAVAADVSPKIQLCRGRSITDKCPSYAVKDNVCVNFKGALTVFNNELSAVVIPDGATCTFFRKFDCESIEDAGADAVILQQGSWYLNSIHGGAHDATVNFEDKASSYICSL